MADLDDEQRPRAAQYLRMSTEHQRYSLESQASMIAGYARAEGIDIVRTYSDAAKSGVRIQGRDGLKQLLADSIGGNAPFSIVLVYDVSRWGRFQDPDEAAHYEYLCREAGLRVVYCAEPWSDDGSTSSSIMKHIKRVMAGEYSRELSRKVRDAHRRQAALGFSQGGLPPFGFRRLLLSAQGAPKGLLARGEYKALSSDRVVWVRGPEEELDLVREIFRLYVRRRMAITRIAARLAGRHPVAGARWTYYRIRHILRDRAYLGLYVYSRTTRPLGAAAIPLNPDQWTEVRFTSPIVSPRVFAEAQRILGTRAVRRPNFTEPQMLAALERIRAKHGRISCQLIDAARDMPSASAFVHRFGSIFRAYEQVGFQPSRRATYGLGRALYDDDEMLSHLQRLNTANGYITASMISADQDAPCPASYVLHFGSLSEAYRKAGLLHDRREIQVQARLRRAVREAGEAQHVGSLAPG